MKKAKVVSVLLLIVLALSLCACGSDGNSGGGDGKKYLIATDTTFAPFEFEDAEGNFVGIDIELLAAIAEDQGFEYELNVLGFSASLNALEAKQADGMIAGMSINDERKEMFDFSDPYFDSGVAMAVKKGSTEINSYADLAGKKVAVKTGTEGSSFAESIKDEYDFELVYFEDSANMYLEVITGNSVALFEDYPVVGYAISQGQELELRSELERGSSYGFAVPKGENPELIEMFNTGLANLRASGKYQEILNKYIQE